MSALPVHQPLAQWERTAQWLLFMLIGLYSLHGIWQVHGADPYEFVRRGNDTLGYYQWLPAYLLEGDILDMYWAHPMGNGVSLSMFTLGIAILELPFFLLGHWAAWSFGYPLDGFSPPYGVALMVGCACYAGIGAVLSFRLARRFSSTVPALLAVLVLFAATNLLHYCVYEPNMSHLFSWMLITLYAWCALRVLDGPRPIHVFLLVSVGLLVVLIRQTNVFSLLFPLLVAGSREGLQRFFKNLFASPRALIFGLVLGLVPWVLQMIYWHTITGDLITFTYGKKEEHFHWDKIAPGLVLFSFRNGWLVYSPILMAVLAMLFRRAWQGTRPARTIVFLTLVCLLIYSAWWCWWLGSGFGHRGFVDLYGLLAIPTAWLMMAIQRRPFALRIAAAVCIVALIHLNLDLTARYEWWWSSEEWTWQRLFEQVGWIARSE